MALPFDFQVAITKRGWTYHKCDGNVYFKSFSTMHGSVFHGEEVPAKELDKQAIGAIFMTHAEFSSLMEMVYKILKGQEGE